MKKMFELKPISINNVIVFVITLSTLLWGIAVVRANVNLNTDFRIQNKNIPACIERVERWIETNRGMPNDVLTIKLKLEYLSEDIQDLIDQLKTTDKNKVKQ